MTVTDRKLGCGHWKAPVADEGVLVQPPTDRWGAILSGNIQYQKELRSRGGQLGEYDFQGRSFHALADQCREEILQAALSYTRSYRDLSGDPGRWRSSNPLIFAGHQPDLLHPGVWAKNFAIDTFAASQGGIAINLLIDADVPKSTSLKVPTGSAQQPILKKIAMDHLPVPVSYENWKITEESLFHSFGRRVATAIEPLVRDPWIDVYWQRVRERARSERGVGLCLAQARHQLEGEWGLSTLELPQSHFCETEAFRWFTAHLLAQLPRLHEIYNTSVAQYRRTYNLRSSTHPVSDLVEENGWLEAPFWIWDAQNPCRRRLLCRPQGDVLLLADGLGLEIPLALTPDGDADIAVSQLADASKSGIRIRTRALMTTMFVRLLCGDIFVHGIGGGKYDQVTDSIIHRFFDIDPPEYMVLSGTLRLQVARPPAPASSLGAINRELRDLKFNPDRFLSRNSGVTGSREWRGWVENKRHWVQTEQSIENANTRHQEITRSNEALQPFVADWSQQLRFQQKEATAQLRADAILSARDYAFCLFPKSQLMHYMLDILPHWL
jgi:hypothetical protein